MEPQVCTSHSLEPSPSPPPHTQTPTQARGKLRQEREVAGAVGAAYLATLAEGSGAAAPPVLRRGAVRDVGKQVGPPHSIQAL
jgi:hypothetical protein